MKLDIYNVLGKKTSSIELDQAIFGIEPHNQSMFDLVMSERAAKRSGNHNTKTRTEVSGGGRKPWRQKGTGRARQGSIRSPQWRGGGVVFGPTNQKNYTLKVNKKIAKLAMKSGWSLKVKDDGLKIIDEIEFNAPKTADFLQMLKNFKIEHNKILLLLKGDKSDYTTYLSANNLVNVLAVPYQELLLEDILNAENVIVTKEVFELVAKGME